MAKKKPENRSSFIHWLRAEMDLLHDPEPDLNQFSEAAETVRQAGRLALSLGLPDVYRLCQVPTEFLAPSSAKALLSECLGACSAFADLPEMVDRKQLAKMLSIDLRSIQRRRLDGTLPKPVKLGRSVRWPRKQIEQLMFGN